METSHVTSTDLSGSETKKLILFHTIFLSGIVSACFALWYKGRATTAQPTGPPTGPPTGQPTGPKRSWMHGFHILSIIMFVITALLYLEISKTANERVQAMSVANQDREGGPPVTLDSGELFYKERIKLVDAKCGFTLTWMGLTLFIYLCVVMWSFLTPTSYSYWRDTINKTMTKKASTIEPSTPTSLPTPTSPTRPSPSQDTGHFGLCVAVGGMIIAYLFLGMITSGPHNNNVNTIV